MHALSNRESNSRKIKFTKSGSEMGLNYIRIVYGYCRAPWVTRQAGFESARRSRPKAEFKQLFR